MAKVRETDTTREIDVGPTKVSGRPLAKLALDATHGDAVAAVALIQLIFYEPPADRTLRRVTLTSALREAEAMSRPGGERGVDGPR
jgi:hypothetical protein